MASRRRKAKREAARTAAKNTSLPKSPLTKHPNDFSQNKGDTVLEAQPKSESVPVKNFVWKAISASGGVLGIVVWLLAVSFNGVFNFFSDVPALQLFPSSILLCGFIFAVLYNFKGKYQENKGSYFLAGAFCFGILIATTVLVQLRGGKPRPHLELCFSVAPERGYPLLLTNDFFNRLNAKNGGDVVRVSLTSTDIDDKGVVIVSVPPGTKSVPVRFLLHNPGVAMNNVAAKLMIPKAISYSVEQPWEVDMLANDPHFETYDSVFPTIVENEYKMLGVINISKQGPPLTSVWIMATSHEIGTVMWAVQLHFKESALTVPPFITTFKFVTNAAGTMTNMQLDYGGHFDPPMAPKK